VSPELKVTDSSLEGGCAVAVDVPPAAALELWRQRLCPGRYSGLDRSAGLCRGDCFVGDLLEGSPARELLKFRYSRRAVTINRGEARARRALWCVLSQDASKHATRHLIAYDSRVLLAIAAKGRANGSALLRELRLTYPHQLAADCTEGALWTDSERNAADSGSRGGPVPVPAPRRPWVARFLQGDIAALDERLAGPGSPEAPPDPHPLPDWWYAWAGVELPDAARG